MVGREGSALALRNPAIREVGIYKRKQESKETRKHVFDKEKKRKLSFFLIVFLVGFLVESVTSFLFSYFLVFFYKFSPQEYPPIISQITAKSGFFEYILNT